MDFYEKSDFQMLAGLWLKQKDLDGKSVVEIARMYYSAISDLERKYKDEVANQNINRAING